MKIKDIMKTEIISLRQDMSVREAVELLFKLDMSGLPVIDEFGRLLGMFTEKDIIRFVLPSYVEKVGSFMYENLPKALRKKMGELSNKKIVDIMQKEIVSVNEELSVAEVARIMLTQKIRRIPVIKEGKVIGIIARGDILKAFIKESGIF
jgi:CBS domain-containing protein